MPSFIDVSVNVVTLIFRSFLVDQSMDHLASALKKAGIKDLPAFFPPNKRDGKVIDEHFKKKGLPLVAEWWAKKQYAVVKEGIVKDLQDMSEHDESTEQVRQTTMYSNESIRAWIRLSLPSNLAKRNNPSQKSNLFNASGKHLWRP
jgi:hypothetical protein